MSLLLALTLCSAVGPASAAEQAVSANPTLSVIASAPDFAMRDPSGEQVNLSNYRGRVVLLAFVFTTCPNVCPLISQQMAFLQRELKREGLFGSKTVMLSVASRRRRRGPGGG